MVIAVRTERGPHCLEIVKAAGSEADRDRLRHEADMLRRGAQPGVVEVLDQTPSVLHLRHCGTSLARLGPLPPDNVAAVVRAVAETVAALHQQGIAHTRISADHVVIGDRGRPRLCGFGDATEATPAHREADVAGLGRLLDELLDAGGEALWSPPHRGVGKIRLRRRAMAGFRAAAAAAQRDDPGQRPTARQLATALHDAFPDLALPVPADNGTEPEPKRRFGPTDSGWTDDDLSFLNVEDESEEEWITGQTPVVDGKAEVVVPSGREWEDFIAEFGDEPEDEPIDRVETEPGPVGPAPTPPVTSAEPLPEREPRVEREPPTISIRPGIAEQATTTRDDRPLLVGVAVVVLALGAVAGALIAQAVRPFGSADVASRPVPTTTTVADPPDEALDDGPGSGLADAAVTPPTFPALCPVPDVAGPDVNGDTCPEPITVDERTATVGTVRVELGEPGDLVVIADSDCDGVATPALLRPATGEVFLFPTWDLDEPTEVPAATVVPGARAITTGTGDCPDVIVTGDDGLREVVAGTDR